MSLQTVSRFTMLMRITSSPGRGRVCARVVPTATRLRHGLDRRRLLCGQHIRSTTGL
jgi:hypothetical protein